MRIAFFCKRHYMGKDVILDRYARLYEIPFQLAKLGHDVRGFCLDYHKQSDGEWHHEAGPGKLFWESKSLGQSRAGGLLRYPLHVLRRLSEFKPDILIGASDIPHASLTNWLAKRLRTPYAIDLYDNFEGFAQARIPGFVLALRRAVRDADLVTTTSEPLQQMVVETYKARGTVLAMPSSVNKSVFKPMDRVLARTHLGLPLDAELIGTAGGLYREKGIEPLYEAWKMISGARPNVHLVLAGPVEEDFPLPSGPRVHYLGHLTHVEVAAFFNALNVGVISVLDTPFGRFCFPQKAYEMLACNLAVVAADVGALSSLFLKTPRLLFSAGNGNALAEAVLRQLETPHYISTEIQDWENLIAGMESGLAEIMRASTDISM